MENNGTKLALRAMKISIFIGLLTVFLTVLNLSVLLTYATGVVGIHKKVDLLEEQVKSISKTN